jgi:hypothetical protein
MLATRLDSHPARVPGTGGRAQARANTEIGCPAPIVDARSVLADLTCVAVAVALGGGEVAAVSALVAGMRPLAQTCAIAECKGNRPNIVRRRSIGVS